MSFARFRLVSLSRVTERERKEFEERERERGVSEFILSVGGACTASHVARRGGREPYA